MATAAKKAPAGAPVTAVKTAPTIENLVFLISRVSTALDTAPVAARSKVSLSQWAMLKLLGDNTESIRLMELAKKLGISRQLVHKTARKLKDLGLATIVEEGEGKKGRLAGITAEGKTALGEFGSFYNEISSFLNEKHPGMKLESSIRVMTAMATSLKKLEVR